MLFNRLRYVIALWNQGAQHAIDKARRTISTVGFGNLNSFIDSDFGRDIAGGEFK